MFAGLSADLTGNFQTGAANIYSLYNNPEKSLPALAVPRLAGSLP
jgi:hypothetical protein